MAHFDTDTLIVGAGLSGVYLAKRMAEKQHKFLLIDERSRTGGRILTDQQSSVDLGPAWFWQEHQHILTLLSELGLDFFRQFDQGEGLFESQQGVQRIAQPQAAPSFRLKGGWHTLINRLVDDIPTQQINMSTSLATLADSEQGVTATLKSAGGQQREVQARRVVLALPPRIVATNIQFTPDLDIQLHKQWLDVPTWMAGHAKAIIECEKPLWREQGLSGFAYSQIGPMMEIHDACETDCAALFGFFGINATQRSMAGPENLKTAIRHQTRRLFNVEASNILIQDWAQEASTAIQLDNQPPRTHPRYGMHPLSIWNNKVILGSTESATMHGGYLEGALNAAQQAMDSIFS